MIDTNSIIVGILTNYQKENFDEDELLEFLYEKRKEYKILKDIPFSKDKGYPQSEEVYDSITTLRISRMITTNLELYRIDPSSFKIAYEEFIKPDLKKTEISQIEELAKDFSKLEKIGLLIN